MTQASAEAEALYQSLQATRAPLILTGAGVSTDSGIPDFRGPSGYWTKNQPVLFQDFVASESVRLESWRKSFDSGLDFAQIQPNVSHYAVAELMRQWPRAHLVTQNVDGLHQKAGNYPERIIEIHGNATYASCLSCNTRYELAAIQCQLKATPNKAPSCEDCGGIVKRATISFGQAMPEAETERAFELAKNCDLILVLGTSLVVYPVAELPETAVRHRAVFALFNQQETPLDSLADIRSFSPLAEDMKSLLEQLGNASALPAAATD